jgi:hypothetical protein
MVKICSVDHVLDESILLVVGQPLVLLLHHFVEWVSEVITTSRYLDLLIEGWVELHNGVIFLLCDVFQKSSSSDIVPNLRIVLQEPCIIIF